MHLADIVQQVGLQVLHVVQLAELAPVIRRDELVELFEGLPAQVVAVHQEQHPPRFGVFDQAVDEIDRGEGLAAAGRHLDQGARAVHGEGALQVMDGLHLGGPQVVGDQRDMLPACCAAGRAACPAGRASPPASRGGEK